MSIRMMPKWGHWFWITFWITVLAAPGFTLGRGGIHVDLSSTGPLSQPHHLPVFVGPVVPPPKLTIVTPSSVVKLQHIETSTQAPSVPADRESSGFARKFEDETQKEGITNQQPNTPKNDILQEAKDVSISQSVSVVSVKYSLSGERRRQNQTFQQEVEDTSSSTYTTTTTSTTTSETTTYTIRSSATPTPTTISTTEKTITTAIPSFSTTILTTTTTTTTTATTTTIGQPYSNNFEQESKVASSHQFELGTPFTSQNTKERGNDNFQSQSPRSFIQKDETPGEISPTLADVVTNKATLSDVVTSKATLPDVVTKTTTLSDVVTSPATLPDVVTSTARGVKALFAATDEIKFISNTRQNDSPSPSSLPLRPQTEPQVSSTSSTPSTTFSSPSPTAPSQHEHVFQDPTSEQRELPPTHSTERYITPTSMWTTPTRIILQEVEEITDIDESNSSAAMESRALHSSAPSYRQLIPDNADEKMPSKTQETTEATNNKMIVEYLEQAELARSFPSTKWNVYEDKDGTWYLQKTATKSAGPESNSESPIPKNGSEPFVEYEELPKVVDVGDGGLSLLDLGDSDRDEEPYEKFMAEESGRSTVGKEAPTDEYAESSSDDDLTPNYDEKNYEEDVEPRMLSAAQQPEPKVEPRQSRIMDDEAQPQKRKPPTIDVTTVVGITVGAFLFILIGTVGLGAFIYHEKYMNKPQTLEDRFSSSDSDGSSVDDPYRRISQIDCVGFDTTRDTFCEEMYNLDNDSFLNSLETVNAPSSYWIRDVRNCDSDV